MEKGSLFSKNIRHKLNFFPCSVGDVHSSTIVVRCVRLSRFNIVK